MTKVLEITKNFLRTFFSSTPHLSQNFLTLLKLCYEILLEEEGQSKSHLGLGYSEVALQKFASFFVLRFVCPAIISPVKYGLVKELSGYATSLLINISKIIQTLSNQQEFQEGSYMIASNEMIRDCAPKMMVFLTKITS